MRSIRTGKKSSAHPLSIQYVDKRPIGTLATGLGDDKLYNPYLLDRFHAKSRAFSSRSQRVSQIRLTLTYL